MDNELAEAHGLGSLTAILSEFEEPAIAFRLVPGEVDPARLTRDWRAHQKGIEHKA